MLGSGAVRAAGVYSVGLCLGSGTGGKADDVRHSHSCIVGQVRSEEVLTQDDRNGNRKKVTDIKGEKAGSITFEEGDI